MRLSSSVANVQDVVLKRGNSVKRQLQTRSVKSLFSRSATEPLLSGQGAPAFLADKRWKGTTERLIKRFPEAPIDINDADNALPLLTLHTTVAAGIALRPQQFFIVR